MKEFEKPRMALLTLAEYRETLERLRRLEKLCARAADALEAWHEDSELPFDSLRREEELIAELRKAAEIEN